eukprot:scaffold7785_cov157-Ochromonas_danica.AAC.1
MAAHRELLADPALQVVVGLGGGQAAVARHSTLQRGGQLRLPSSSRRKLFAHPHIRLSIEGVPCGDVGLVEQVEELHGSQSPRALQRLRRDRAVALQEATGSPEVPCHLCLSPHSVDECVGVDGELPDDLPQSAGQAGQVSEEVGQDHRLQPVEVLAHALAQLDLQDIHLVEVCQVARD